VITPYAKKRLDKICEFLNKEHIALAMFEDFENKRDKSIRWFSGIPYDALLFISSEGKTMLVPWDVNLAKKLGPGTDMFFAYSDVNRDPVIALAAAAQCLKIPPGSKVEVPASTPYRQFLRFVEKNGDYDIICRENGVHAQVEQYRAVKDEYELSVYRTAAGITNELIALIEKKVTAGKLKTEAEAALFIELETRKRGCEGTGFETIAAGPERSFEIHAWPAYSGGDFGTRGLSILDFGVKYLGYTTDVTMTFAREPLTAAQKTIVRVVEKTYNFMVGAANKGLAESHEAIKKLEGGSAAGSRASGNGADVGTGSVVAGGGGSHGGGSLGDNGAAAATAYHSGSTATGAAGSVGGKVGDGVVLDDGGAVRYAAQDLALEVAAFFQKSHKAMPHALGHGIGLEAHESPGFRTSGKNDWKLCPNMVIALEPGLYDPKAGGCRLENDFLVTETSLLQLTKSSIVRL
jgi:Xaa-Pro dipeptidase